MGWNDFDGVGMLAVAMGPESFCGDDKGAADSYQGGQVETVRVPWYVGFIEKELLCFLGVVYKAPHLTLKRTMALTMVLAGGHFLIDTTIRFCSNQLTDSS